MKKKLLAVCVVVLMAMFAMASCSQSEFGGMASDSGKEINLNAKNADEDSAVMPGGIEVGEDEQITIDSQLEEGKMTIEFFSVEEGAEDVEEMIEEEGLKATYTAYINGTESQAVSFGGGYYMVRATVTEKANGTVDILVKGIEQ